MVNLFDKYGNEFLGFQFMDLAITVVKCLIPAHCINILTFQKNLDRLISINIVEIQ